MDLIGYLETDAGKYYIATDKSNYYAFFRIINNISIRFTCTKEQLIAINNYVVNENVYFYNIAIEKQAALYFIDIHGIEYSNYEALQKHLVLNNIALSKYDCYERRLFAAGQTSNCYINKEQDLLIIDVAHDWYYKDPPVEIDNATSFNIKDYGCLDKALPLFEPEISYIVEFNCSYYYSKSNSVFKLPPIVIDRNTKQLVDEEIRNNIIFNKIILKGEINE